MNDMTPRAHPVRSKAAAALLSLSLAVGFAAVSTPAPASASIAVNPSTWDNQAATLDNYANQFRNGAASADLQSRTLSELDYVMSTVGGSAAQSLMSEKIDIQSYFQNSMSVFAAPRLERIADWLQDSAAAYRAADASAGEHFPG